MSLVGKSPRNFRGRRPPGNDLFAVRLHHHLGAVWRRTGERQPTWGGDAGVPRALLRGCERSLLDRLTGAARDMGSGTTTPGAVDRDLLGDGSGSRPRGIRRAGRAQLAETLVMPVEEVDAAQYVMPELVHPHADLPLLGITERRNAIGGSQAREAEQRRLASTVLDRLQLPC